MQGMGKSDARTVTDSPGFRTCEVWPSIESPAAARERSLIYILERNESVGYGVNEADIRG